MLLVTSKWTTHSLCLKTLMMLSKMFSRQSFRAKKSMVFVPKLPLSPFLWCLCHEQNSNSCKILWLENTHWHAYILPHKRRTQTSPNKQAQQSKHTLPEKNIHKHTQTPDNFLSADTWQKHSSRCPVTDLTAIRDCILSAPWTEAVEGAFQGPFRGAVYLQKGWNGQLLHI